MEKLLRSRTGKVFAGVCAGLGKFFGCDPTIWRLIFLFGTLFTIFPFICAYIIMWFAIPREEETSK
jgi:phage shock protein PspC (stress-responsive transcriptional regulator)